jgi:hypothetical protein
MHATAVLPGDHGTTVQLRRRIAPVAAVPSRRAAAMA